MRNLTQSFRNSLEDQFSSEIIAVFMTVGVGQIANPVNLINDTVDYMLAGTTYTGFPFTLALLTDSATPPTAKLTVQNIDQRIGTFIQSLNRPPRIDLQVYAASDFNLPVRTNGRLTRTPIATPTRQLWAPNLRLRNVTVDITEVSGDLGSYDPTGEPYPANRTTKDKAPGLYILP